MRPLLRRIPPARAVTLLALLTLARPPVSIAATQSLDGEWRFALDRDDVGVDEAWFTRELPDQIQLPGILQAQGYGDEIGIKTPWVLSLYDRYWYLRDDYQAYTNKGNVKVPFLCQPERHYVGVAWYQRDIRIPKAWDRKRVALFLERTRWETTVWINDRRVGSVNSLVAPHEYELGTLTPGRHRLTLRIDSRMLMRYRPDAHAVSDSLGSTWNGVVGRIELNATTPVWLDDVQVYPDADNRSVRIRARIGNVTGTPGRGRLSVGKVQVPVYWESDGGKAEMEVSLGPRAKLWDEFDPALHRLKIQLKGDQANDSCQVTYGLRRFEAQGREFVMNGRLTHLRGTHQGGDFPLTGHPPCDVEYWLKLFRTCKKWGLNHVRFHSFCPPDAAFTAADQLGMYLQPECGMWNEISPGTEIEEMMYAETDRMIRAYGNHPSFVLFSPSNEPKARWKQSLPEWIKYYREHDPRRLYTSGTGWSLIDDPQPVADRVDYLAVHRVGPRLMRGSRGWFGTDYSSSYEGVDVPNIVHENGQWCAYPDYRVIGKFTGFIQAGNFEIFRDSLAAHGMEGRDQDFAWSSGRFQLQCYKEEVEANLRTPGLGGFQLLDLHDYTGQGTALVGLLDPFWDAKTYVTAEEWRQFCNTTVPLARLRNRVFTTSDTFEVPVELAHYGRAPVQNAAASWRVLDSSGQVAAQGTWPPHDIPLGKATSLGVVNVDLSTLPAPEAYRLVVELVSSSGRDKFKNDWNFWLYPEGEDTPATTTPLLTRSWDEAEAALNEGDIVLFVPRRADLNWRSPPLDRVPVFWNRLMNPGWSRMLGLWCDTEHPALAGFPTEANCDWQWTSIISGVRAMNLDSFADELQPIVQAVDDWNRNWKLGVVFEARVGDGRLMVCTVDLEDDLDQRPAARQLRRSLLDYMQSARFEPSVAISVDQMRTALFDTRIMNKLGATVEADGNDPEAIIDGDPNTYWLVGAPARGVKPTPHPHELTVRFPEPVTLQGVVLMPRQNDRNHQGDICQYRLEASEDGQRWQEIAQGKLPSTFDPQTLMFETESTAKYLRLTALSGFGEDPSAALAELAVIHTGASPEGTDAGPIEYRRVRSTSTDVDEGD